MAKRKVLIIEDDRGLSKLLSQMLKDRDYEVAAAYDGLEGLKLAEDFKPEIALLDVNLPLMDGLQVLQALKSSPKTGSIPVVMCTEHSVIKEVENALALGACGYIIKPFTTERVLAKVSEILGPG